MEVNDEWGLVNGKTQRMAGFLHMMPTPDSIARLIYDSPVTTH